jgi:hypothetical protein
MRAVSIMKVIPPLLALSLAACSTTSGAPALKAYGTTAAPTVAPAARLGTYASSARSRQAEGAAGDDQTALAKRTQNPIANLISLPLQNNTNFKYGPDNFDSNSQNVLNIQPVIPVELGEWNMISRTIMPVVYNPKLGPGATDEFGLGDVVQQTFFSPAKPGKVIWGVGPIAQLPTHNRNLGVNAWGLGPAAVALTMRGKWVMGAVASQTFGIGGSERHDLSLLLVQPFINYNLEDGWYLSSSPIITANWEAVDSDDKWTVPLGGGAGKVFRIGKQALNASVQAFGNVVNPDFGPDWTLRVQLQFLFPKKK